MTTSKTQLWSSAVAVVLVSSSCATPALAPASATAFPPEARRKSPPAAIGTTALVAGAKTSAVPLQDDQGRPRTLGGPNDASRLVLFYRGHW